VRKIEAYALLEIFSTLDNVNHNKKLLNIGSSTKYFRSQVQPHIQKMFDNMEMQGWDIRHLDLKPDKANQYCLDITDPANQKNLKAESFDVILIANVLEHITPAELPDFVTAILRIAIEGTRLVVTVPYSYPLHEDPIDSYLRPTPEEICRLFNLNSDGYSKIIKCGNFLEDFIGFSISYKTKILLRLLLPFYKFRTWVCLFSSLGWLFRSYKISIVKMIVK